MAATFPVHVLYGTCKYNRFDFEDPYTRQGIEKLATFMQEAPRQTQAGIVTRNGAEDFRMELGMNYTMGTIDWTTTKELVTTNTWHAHLVHTVYEHNKKSRKIEIIEDTTRLSLLRINDEFLM